MNISICSRAAVEEKLAQGTLGSAAVISFYDPPQGRAKIRTLPPIDYRGKAERVFSVALHDLDRDVLPSFGLSEETYFPAVDELAEFIHKAVADNLSIICQCEYGQSRSAACAAAILQHFEKDGISIFADYRYYPNQLVYNKIFNALERYPHAE